jgi:hypothetical protein
MHARTEFCAPPHRACRTTPRCACCGERGQAMPFVVLIMVMAALACVALIQLAGAATDAARARTAADAAALAGVRDGIGAARRLAAANGSTVVSYRELSDVEVEVVVTVGEATALATAELAVKMP